MTMQGRGRLTPKTLGHISVFQRVSATGAALDSSCEYAGRTNVSPTASSNAGSPAAFLSLFIASLQSSVTDKISAHNMQKVNAPRFGRCSDAIGPKTASGKAHLLLGNPEL